MVYHFDSWSTSVTPWSLVRAYHPAADDGDDGDDGGDDDDHDHDRDRGDVERIDMYD